MVSGRLLLWIFVSHVLSVWGQERPVCLTGEMTDVQSWVDSEGRLTENLDPDKALDLSNMVNPSSGIRNFFGKPKGPKGPRGPKGSKEVQRPVGSIRYMSLAHCQLNRIPGIFTLRYDDGRNLSQTLEYLSFYGNMFVEVSVPGQQYDVVLTASKAREVDTGNIHRGQARSMWSAGFQRVMFSNLKELDLRNCGISTLDEYIFQTMPELEALYLGENVITTINPLAFMGLSKLKHLDLSDNNPVHVDGNRRFLEIENDMFTGLDSLKSLDFSGTLASFRRVSAMDRLAVNLERLSLCASNAILPANFFQDIPLKYLDLSMNRGVLLHTDVLNGLDDTLEVLYASEAGLTSFDVFQNFSKLEILRVANNEVNLIKRSVARTLTNLQVLDINRNRLSNWFTDTFSLMPSLKLLDLRNNMITVISTEMMSDLANVSFIAMSRNTIVCNCHSREFIELAARNEILQPIELVKPLSNYSKVDHRFNFHLGFRDVNEVILRRNNMSDICKKGKCANIDFLSAGNYILFDYDRNAYECMKMTEGEKMPFREVNACMEMYFGLSPGLQKGRNQLLALLAIPGLLLPALLILYIFRRNLRYCFLMMRNSAMLSLVNKNIVIDDDTIFNYDVFVSYCNEDRPWVLDQLLTHLEMDCNVSLCLHERDFQVGLSILENIVSCMDRSKAIMLVISQQFLLSQWCQFEMHLAQHRLLETRREDLILILLEDIPRRLRPNTLHYLMLTKTYIVWPKNKAEEAVFWKRLKKSVITQKQKPERVSLA